MNRYHLYWTTGKYSCASKIVDAPDKETALALAEGPNPWVHKYLRVGELIEELQKFDPQAFVGWKDPEYSDFCIPDPKLVESRAEDQPATTWITL